MHKNIIIAANDIAKDILETIENPDFWELNCLMYATAMTCREYNNDIRRTEPEKVKEKLDMPKLIYHLVWKGIWNSPLECNVANVDWMKELESSYCLNATQKLYEIDKMARGKATNKLKAKKAPARDMITGYWYKQLNFYRPDLTRLYKSTLVNDQVLPTWLSTAKTTLLPKITDTDIAKNYRPIALLNMMYKIYTSCINMFLTDHVLHKNIITNEQAGGEKGT